jgi:hypothetical protein
VVEVNFQGKRDIAMSLKYAIVECLYEYKNKKSIKDEISQDELTYLAPPTDQPFKVENPKIVKTYENEK